MSTWKLNTLTLPAVAERGTADGPSSGNAGTVGAAVTLPLPLGPA